MLLSLSLFIIEECILLQALCITFCFIVLALKGIDTKLLVLFNWADNGMLFLKSFELGRDLNLELYIVIQKYHIYPECFLNFEFLLIEVLLDIKLETDLDKNNCFDLNIGFILGVDLRTLGGLSSCALIGVHLVVCLWQ